MDVIVKYEFQDIPADAKFNQQEISKRVLAMCLASLRLKDNKGDAYYSDNAYPEVFVSTATTLITTDLENKGVFFGDTKHLDVMRGFLIMFDKEIKKLSRPEIFRDKNGLQFYEGCILQYTAHKGYAGVTSKMLVCWDKDNACYGYISEHATTKRIIPFTQHDEVVEDVFNHCELIGTVESHKELLCLFE